MSPYVLEQTLGRNWVEWRGWPSLKDWREHTRTGGSTQLWGCDLLIFLFPPQKMLQFKFSNQTYVEYNQYITAMVGCLWTSSAFQKDIHPQGLRMDDQLLSKTAVKELKNSFNIVYHPAMMGYSIQFLKQVMVWAEIWIFHDTRYSVLIVSLERGVFVSWLTGRGNWALKSCCGILCLSD